MNSQEICNIINQCHDPKEAAQRISDQVRRSNFAFNVPIVKPHSVHEVGELCDLNSSQSKISLCIVSLAVVSVVEPRQQVEKVEPS